MCISITATVGGRTILYAPTTTAQVAHNKLPKLAGAVVGSCRLQPAVVWLLARTNCVGHNVPIYRILENVAFDPERIEFVAKAFENTLRTYDVRDRTGPLAAKIAKAIFHAAQRGEQNPERLQQAAVAELGLSILSVEPVVSTGPSPSRPTVLIVEDDEAFAYAASRYLESRGYRSVVASGSMAAFRELDRQSVDVVVADVLLGKNEPYGVSLGRLIRNRDQNMPVLLVTGFPDLLEKAAPLPGPAMIKPVDLSQLATAIETSLRDRNLTQSQT
jgi:ActR/RegA family two-component response regulator